MARTLAVAAVAVGLTAAADDTPAKNELARFTGTWKGVSVVEDGKELPEAERYRLAVDGERYTLVGEGDEPVTGTHTPNPAAKPKQIDAARTGGAGKGDKLLGVYEPSEDTFVVCLAAAGKERPKELAPKGGPGLRVLAFKRDTGR